MRRVILWIVALLITFAIGAGSDSLRRYLSAKQPPSAKVEAAHVEIAQSPPISPPSPKPNLILDYDREKFVPYVALYIMGPAPQGFKDFDCIELDLYNGGPGTEPGNIYVSSGAGQNHTQIAIANFALVTERTLYFTTSPSEHEGFQYRFEGEFLVKDFDSVAGKNKAAVRGKLTRSKNGRTIAEHTITFQVYNIGC